MLKSTLLNTFPFFYSLQNFKHLFQFNLIIQHFKQCTMQYNF